jgi:hypothetical protein
MNIIATNDRIIAINSQGITIAITITTEITLNIPLINIAKVKGI